jgi:hypothetical protein
MKLPIGFNLEDRVAAELYRDTNIFTSVGRRSAASHRNCSAPNNICSTLA